MNVGGRSSSLKTGGPLRVRCNPNPAGCICTAPLQQLTGSGQVLLHGATMMDEQMMRDLSDWYCVDGRRG